MPCKYLPFSPYKALEKFYKALYGDNGKYLQCTCCPSCHSSKFRASKYNMVVEKYQWKDPALQISKVGRLLNVLEHVKIC